MSRLLCAKSTDMGNYALLCNLILLVHVSMQAVKIIDPLPQNVFAISGSQVNITCIVVGDNGLPPVRVKFQRRKLLPNYEEKWLDIPETETVFQTNKTEGNRITATLYFTNITIEDDTSKGRHACIGYSTKGGKGERHGFTIHVTAVEDLPVARLIPNITVSYGDSARLYCNLTHDNNEQTTPIKKVTYLKNGKHVKTTTDVNQPLILNSVGTREGGDYRCKITVYLKSLEAYDVTSSAAYLHVRVRFPISEVKLTADIGDSVAMVCSAEGYPLNIEWRRNFEGKSAIIKPKGRFILQGKCSFCDSILVIQNATAEDSGNYSCSASNGPGQQFFLVKVANGTLINVAHATSVPSHVKIIMPAFLWTWWNSF